MHIKPKNPPPISNPHKINTTQKIRSAKQTMLVSNPLQNQLTNSKGNHDAVIKQRYCFSQPKLQNKKMKYYRISHSAFFNHLNSTKLIQKEQVVDESYQELLYNTRKNNRGLRGTKTHSWNQLMYLTPQKRFKNHSQQLQKVKKQLYSIIKAQQSSYDQQNVQKIPVKGTLVQFLTDYNNQDKYDLNQEQENKNKFIFTRKNNSNVIKQKLKNYNRKIQEQRRIKKYQLVLKGCKFL